LLFFLTDLSTTDISTLSLHDALPISRGMPRAARGGARARRTLRTLGQGQACRHCRAGGRRGRAAGASNRGRGRRASGRCRQEKRSEEHTSELQSLAYLVCRLLLEKKK